MVTLEDAARIAAELDGVTEGTRYGNRSWSVRGKAFVWERPFNKADLKRFGDAPVPEGPVLGLLVEDLHEKAALLAEGRPGVFTIPHFDGYAAVLLDLSVLGADDLRELVEQAWRSAP